MQGGGVLSLRPPREAGRGLVDESLRRVQRRTGEGPDMLRGRPQEDCGCGGSAEATENGGLSSLRGTGATYWVSRSTGL